MMKNPMKRDAQQSASAHKIPPIPAHTGEGEKLVRGDANKKGEAGFDLTGGVRYAKPRV
jgi:hypothetical protein